MPNDHLEKGDTKHSVKASDFFDVLSAKLPKERMDKMGQPNGANESKES